MEITMPLFDYTGQLTSGTAFQGTLEADSQEEAAATLGAMGVRATALRPAQRMAYVAPLSLHDLTFFNEQLTAMTEAGLPLDQGLRQLAAEVGSSKLKRLLLDLADDLAAGLSLEQALEKQQQRFPRQYAQVVGAGLKSGDLAGTLYGLTTHLRLKSDVRRSLLELGAYPLLVLFFAFLVSSFVMTSVEPGLRAMANDFIQDAYGPQTSLQPQSPLFTLARVWPVVRMCVLAAFMAGVVLFVVVCLPGLGELREAVLRRLPGFAQIYWSSVQARFAHTSALAAHAGRPMPELIRVSGTASGSPALNRAASRVAERLNVGETLEQAVQPEPLMPPLWLCAAAVAAPRGDLSAALVEVARAYELRARQWVTTLRTVLGPLLFLVVATSIGGLIIAIIVTFQTLLLYITSLTNF
jgi:type II secretory pathway component PulF